VGPCLHKSVAIPPWLCHQLLRDSREHALQLGRKMSDTASSDPSDPSPKLAPLEDILTNGRNPLEMTTKEGIVG